jgi:hypothetical protein
VDQTEDQNQLNRNPSSLIPDGNRFSFWNIVFGTQGSGQYSK